VLGFTTQAFYKWQASPVSQRDPDDAHLINAALDIHHDDPAFGYRCIADEMHERGLRVGENRVARLCSQQRICSIFAEKRGLTRKAGPPVHDDLVDRVFTAPAPNVLWLTDITEHRTAEGKLFLCAVKDACSKRIVGYSIDSRMTSELAVTALRNALALRGSVATVVLRPRQPAPLPRLRAHAAPYAAPRLDAPGRGVRGQGRTATNPGQMMVRKSPAASKANALVGLGHLVDPGDERANGDAAGPRPCTACCPRLLEAPRAGHRFAARALAHRRARSRTTSPPGPVMVWTFLQ
jgi:hypothetical protein